MISVDTIRLLQQKVESAVQKIEQLKSENDALRAERSELTKALSEKSELLSRFSADEKKIEDGILGALNRLDSVENALLDNAESSANPSAAQSAPEQTTSAVEQEQAQAPASPEPQAAPVQQQASFTTPVQQAQTAQVVAEPLPTEEAPESQQESDDGLFGDDSFETQEESVPDIF